jgi:Flp pilus assembly protein TadG
MALSHRTFFLGISGIGGFVRRLVKARDGVETIEFALAAIPLFMFLLGVVEFARLYWTQSELQYAAEAAARCATVNCCASGPTSCGGSTGNTGVQNFAAGQLLGMSIPSGNLSNFQVSTASCGNQVSFSYTFNFIVGQLLPTNGAITLSATACNQA